MSDEEAVLLGLVRLAGPEGRSSSELRLGCRCIRGQDRLLERLEKRGLVTSEQHQMPFAGKRWRAVRGVSS